MRRYDAIYPRNYERKDGTKATDWMRCGVLFDAGEDKKTLILYMVPNGNTEVPGEIRIVFKPSDGREQQRAGAGGPPVQQRRPQRSPPQHEPDVEGWPPQDDNIPF